MNIALWLVVGSLSLFTVAPGAEAPVYDVVVYGGTSAAVTAAVQARIMGKSAVVVSPDLHLGGLSSGGLGWTDTGNKSVIGGLARHFYHRLWKYYDQETSWRWQPREDYGNRGQGTPAMDGEQRTMWVFEPHAAEQVFEDLVREYDLEVHRDEWLDREAGVKKEGNRILSLTTLSGKVYRGRMFIDATYEGDLMAAAGVTYHVGRESNAAYGETINGVQKARAISHQFEHFVDPYVVPGDPNSGLLPRIHDGDPGEDGEGDHRVQAYNYRMCLTDLPENRIPFPKPENYDPQQYELLGRYIDAGYRGMVGKFDPIPNRKTDTNNHGAFSTDNIGMNYDYPEASYERRREILREHQEYQQGYFWFLANDPRTAPDVRAEMSRWGLAADEFADNGHWPRQIYVREARRMASDFVITENHLRRIQPTPRPIGMGSYNMDSHNTQRYVAYDEAGRAHARNEGDIQISPGGPYPIDYGAIVPKESECANLLTPVCVSASHIAYGSIRMEPVFMILGQSAATAAALALDLNASVQQLPYELLSKRLLEDGQVLETAFDNVSHLDPARLEGLVMDNPQAETTGTWRLSSSISPMVGLNYLHTAEPKGEQAEARYRIPVPEAGRYEVRVSYSPHPNRASNVSIVVRHADGASSLRMDQRRASGSEGPFASLGEFSFEQEALIVVSTADADGYVIADAVQLLRK